MPHECFLIRNDYGWKTNYDLPNDFKMCVSDYERKINFELP